jgi:amidase
MARSAEDLAVALDILGGADTLDADGWQLALPPPRRTSLRGLRVAVWPNDATSPVDDEIAGRVQQIADVIAREGGIVSDRARPSFDVASYRSTYVALVMSIMGAATPDAAYVANEAIARALDPNDTTRGAMATRALVLRHRDWLRHHTERMRLREVWRAFFQEWDILLCPVMATPAFLHERRPSHERTILVNGREQPYFDQVFWASLATLTYLPATIFPSGPSKDGLPIGIQAIGAEYADRTTIELARLMAIEIGGFRSPPRRRDEPRG